MNCGSKQDILVFVAVVVVDYDVGFFCYSKFERKICSHIDGWERERESIFSGTGEERRGEEEQKRREEKSCVGNLMFWR